MSGSKHDKTGKTKGAKRPWESCHVEIINGFRQEFAWKALKAGSRVVYVELKARYNGFNNGRIMASERFLAKQTGFGKNTVSRALQELQEKGFIRKTRAGVLGADGKGTGACWALTELGILGERPTKDFKKWQPKNRIPGPKRTQGGSKTDPVKAGGGSEMDPGWIQNGPREWPKTPDKWVRNGPNLIDVPGAGEDRPASQARPSPKKPESKNCGEFVGTPHRFTAVIGGRQ